MTLSKKNKVIMYGVIFLLFIGIATVGITSCMVKEREGNNQHDQATYGELKKDYDTGLFEAAQGEFDEFKMSS